ncbi:VPS35 B isoform 3 [Hibiscus syriacus]|uniref:VPS35 B isoform 3 n=1 Tax=Hibiscus syriacus TaxID=106335 RepID=A0A6A2WK81_HIBSY|nr:VPS35 B isoform 3 [Hibiscus syriacus]
MPTVNGQGPIVLPRDFNGSVGKVISFWSKEDQPLFSRSSEKAGRTVVTFKVSSSSTGEEREKTMLNGEEDEEKWLVEGITGIQHNAFYMHRALDSNNLREALKYSAQMLSELRTSKLSPHNYELYMRAFDELSVLEMFFKDESKHGVYVVDLYELVQHAGNILPRLDVDTVMDAVEFVLQNFSGMNKLWVRMQHQKPGRARENRKKESSELQDLVGKISMFSVR